MEERRISVHLCSGCDIGTSLDLDSLGQISEEIPCKTHPTLCSKDGLATIQDDIRNGSHSLIVAACSPRFKSEEFRFDGCTVERVSLREQVVWTHPPNDEDTQLLAEDYLRMALAKAARVEATDPHKTDVDRTLLVLGAGVTGLTAALEAARAGTSVILVEKNKELGGWRREFSPSFSHSPPYSDYSVDGIDKLITDVKNQERITIHTASEIESVSGQPGQFTVQIASNGSTQQVQAGAIVQATGWKPYDPDNLGHLGYGKSPDVVTNVQMEQILKSANLVRPSDGTPIRTVAFVQCAGSRDPDHLPYCSTVCCRVTIKQALQIRELSSEVQALVFYKDIRTPGQYEDLYRKAQTSPGILFTKGEVQRVEPQSDGQLRLEVDKTLLGSKILVDADLVVLATGMVSRAVDGETLRAYRDAESIVKKGEKGAKLAAAEKIVEELKSQVSESVLNLDYRQGPDTPTLKYGFPDSHFICFPYETRRTGIYLAGCARAPNDIEGSQNDGTGAALKAIQCLELASHGMAVHPRWEDMSYPEFFLQRCTQCKRCTEECPFGVLNEDEKGTPKPNPTRCRRCGICMGACPERVISFKDYSIDIVSSMIKAVDIPDEFEEKPRILGFICENDAYPALDTAGLRRRQYNAYIRFIPVRCLGSVNVVWIADALSRGFDGILLVGCKSGENYQCHFIRGSEIMGIRGANVREKLLQLALEEERVRVEELSITEFDRLPQIIDEFSEEIVELGLNPFKGF